MPGDATESTTESQRERKRPFKPRPKRPVTGEILDQDAAAAFLGLTNPRTMAAWRLRRQGPAYYRFGAAVRYRRADLEAWMAAQRVAHGAA